MSNYNTMKSVIAEFSGQANIITVPRIFVELTGDYNTAILLNQIIFWSDKTKRTDGLFYKTYKEWEDEIYLTEYQVRRSVKKLKELGIVDTELKRANGSPTVHYRYNEAAAIESILKKLKNGTLQEATEEVHTKETQETIPKKLKEPHQRNSRNDTEETKETITDDYTDDNTVNKTIVEETPTSIIPEVIKYFNEKTGKNLGTVRSNIKDIQARINEGNYTLEQFKKVIDIKYSQWHNNPDMKKYLRPATLFGTKFEAYLNEELVGQDLRNYNAMQPRNIEQEEVKEAVEPEEDRRKLQKLKDDHEAFLKRLAAQQEEYNNR